jgi:hypothetical protein
MPQPDHWRPKEAQVATLALILSPSPELPGLSILERVRRLP